jgi:hypothetical protein
MQDTNARFLQSNQDLGTPPDYYIKKLSKFQSEKQAEGFARGFGRRARFSPFVQQGMETRARPVEEQDRMET